jgi:vinculin
VLFTNKLIFYCQTYGITILNIFQVSRLVILHEESADDDNLMPDLSKSVQVVKSAVDNLVKVGHETCSTSTDDLLRTDMPQALERVNQASTLLIDAAHILKYEPCSIKGRQMLIQGARCKSFKTIV